MAKDSKKKRETIKTVFYFIIIIALVALGIYSGIKKPGANNPKMQTLDNGLVIEIVKEGSGVEVKNGDVAVVSYTGIFEDGTAFDSNVDPSFRHPVPFEFTVGAGHVIKGWDLGVLGMKIGEKRKLTLPPALGYGASGNRSIPPNSTLIFDVELIGIKHD